MLGYGDQRSKGHVRGLSKRGSYVSSALGSSRFSRSSEVITSVHSDLALASTVDQSRAQRKQPAALSDMAWGVRELLSNQAPSLVHPHGQGR